MRLFIAGDTHGNTRFLADTLYPTAGRLKADAIIQLGDFGAWEHTPAGKRFFDAVAKLARRHHIPLYWLHGNHDKHSLVLSRYGHDRNAEGFIRCRHDLFYIPQGHIWTWAGVRMRAFGGAYSIDKTYRLKVERQQYDLKVAEEMRHRAKGGRPREVPSTAGTQWFPEEEMTDDEMDALLAADSGELGVVFSHDAPAGADLGIKLKPEPLAHFNRQRLQRAMNAHLPTLWLHGHMHHYYVQDVRCGDDGTATKVIGLAPDYDAAGRFWRPWQSWCLLDLHDGGVTFTSGADAEQELDDEDDLDAEHNAWIKNMILRNRGKWDR